MKRALLGIAVGLLAVGLLAVAVGCVPLVIIMVLA